MSRLSDLLAEVMAVTRPPKGMDAASVTACTLRYMRIMRDYSEDVAAKALDDWPKTHQFFPTEPELHQALRDAYRALRPHSKAPPYDDGMGPNPVGATMAFIKELRAIAPSKAHIYFDNGEARFSESHIGVRCSFVPEIIEKHAPGLLAKHGVRIVEPKCFHDNGNGTYGIEWRWP